MPRRSALGREVPRFRCRTRWSFSRSALASMTGKASCSSVPPASFWSGRIDSSPPAAKESSPCQPSPPSTVLFASALTSNLPGLCASLSPAPTLDLRELCRAKAWAPEPSPSEIGGGAKSWEGSTAMLVDATLSTLFRMDMSQPRPRRRRRDLQSCREFRSISKSWSGFTTQNVGWYVNLKYANAPRLCPSTQNRSLFTGFHGRCHESSMLFGNGTRFMT